MAADPRIMEAASAWCRAGHGGKTDIVRRLASDLGVSYNTAYKRIGSVALKAPRKRRSDACKLTLTRTEAVCIAAGLEEMRNRKDITARLETVVNILRANGRILAGRLDETTGEFVPLTLSAIRQGMRSYGFHPDQLTESSPATRLRSPHPNWCWQIDASISGQFYLADDGTRWMQKGEFYSGKPQNFSRISDKRLWRYVITDHCTGAIEMFYVLGSETSANFLSALIFVMTKRANGTMHGIPKYLMTDPGSAPKAGPTMALVKACGIDFIINKRGNARAKGQVEGAHAIVGIDFELPLKLARPVASLQEINESAQQWSRALNATRVHTRHGMTRRDAWLRITSEQLLLAPDVETLKQLANTPPKLCTVRDCMIRFRGGVYDVRGVPELINGQRVEVVANALDAESSVRVLMPNDENGKPVHYVVPKLRQDGWGFVESAATIGLEYRARPETPADAARKELERVAMEVQTDAEAVAARKAKRLAFGGSVDPMKHIREANAAIPEALPRAGTPSGVEAPAIAQQRIEPAPIRAELPALNHVEAAMRLKPLVERAGQTWTADMYARTAQRWPDGLPIDEVEAWAEALAKPERGGLRVVGGAA